MERLGRHHCVHMPTPHTRNIVLTHRPSQHQGRLTEPYDCAQYIGGHVSTLLGTWVMAYTHFIHDLTMSTFFYWHFMPRHHMTEVDCLIYFTSFFFYFRWCHSLKASFKSSSTSYINIHAPKDTIDQRKMHKYIHSQLSSLKQWLSDDLENFYPLNGSINLIIHVN